jgi:hypothetical protein
VTDLFRKGHAPSEPNPEDVIEVKLGTLGIRDLAMLPGKRILVLAGAARGRERTFKLFIVDPDSRTATPVGSLPEVEQSVKGKKKVGKAEGLTVLDADQGRIIVLFDGLPDGAPHLGKISLQ